MKLWRDADFVLMLVFLKQKMHLTNMVIRITDLLQEIKESIGYTLENSSMSQDAMDEVYGK